MKKNKVLIDAVTQMNINIDVNIDLILTYLDIDVK